MTIKIFQKREKHSSFGQIFVVGGLNNEDYKPFHKAFNLLLTNHSARANDAAESISEDVRAFCESLVYVNLLMNIGGEDNNKEATAATFITDLTIMFDRATDPPTLWIAQYFGTERRLHGGRRDIQPWLIFIYDFTLRGWCVVDLHPHDHQRSALAPMVLAAFQRSQVDNPSDPDALETKVKEIFNILPMIEG